MSRPKKPAAFRVDRIDCTQPIRVPAGMNSITCLSSDAKSARTAFEATPTGLDCWNKPNPAYGVILSTWDAVANDYRVLAVRRPS